jgi:hypothetical protein
MRPFESLRRKTLLSKVSGFLSRELKEIGGIRLLILKAGRRSTPSHFVRGGKKREGKLGAIAARG